MGSLAVLKHRREGRRGGKRLSTGGRVVQIKEGGREGRRWNDSQRWGIENGQGYANV